MTHRTTSSTPVKKPHGGFRTISNLQICWAWSAYHTCKRIEYLDFRVYLAIHELEERRRAAHRQQGRRGRYVFKTSRDNLLTELRGLVGGAGGRHLRASLRRLERAGLVSFDKEAIVISESLCSATPDTAQAAVEMMRRIDCRRTVNARKLAVPRSAISHIARGARPTTAATMLGHVMRCVWPTEGRWRSEGACPASFISRVFGVHHRTVRSAIAELREERWMYRLPADAKFVRDHGSLTGVNPFWKTKPARADVPPQSEPDSESPPELARMCSGSPPAYKKHYLPSESLKPKPVFHHSQTSQSCTPCRLPDFLHVVPEDLESPKRLTELFRQAVQLKLVSGSGCDRLRFFASAVHAQRIGTSNPCGLFVATIRKRRWTYLTQADEDLAQSRIRQLQARVGEELLSSCQDERGKVVKLVETLASLTSLQSELDRRNSRRLDSNPARKHAA